MAPTTGKCETIRVQTFRGDRTAAYRTMFEQKLDVEDQIGVAPTNSDVMLYSGHAGVSFDKGATIYGFNPDGGKLTTRQLLNDLKNRLAFPGIVRDDTVVFATARIHGLKVLEFDVRMPQIRYAEIKSELANQLNTSNYTCGFPNGDGECNCVTWIERIGVPLLTGRVDEFELVTNFAIRSLKLQQRRFGKCT